jgi:hypothetical protein
VKGGGEMYYALIGDIVDSKAIQNRLEVQETLSNYLETINQTFHDDISANFIITLGDEFQGLLKSPTHLFEIIMKIQIIMQPYKIRFGIGMGQILTKINNKMSIGADGPAWWNARNMIIELKQNEKGMKSISNIKISGLKNKLVLDLININLSICYSIEQKWTIDQKQIIDYIIIYYGLTDKFTQKKLADELNISTVNLNKKLKLSLFYDYMKAKAIITHLLEIEGIE